MPSMDMRKAFGTIDHTALIRGQRSGGLPAAYVALIFLLYANQMASVNVSSKFRGQQGVKQGDTLTAILFNCVLDVAFDERRRSLDKGSLYIVQGVPRLSNIRYAGDILFFARLFEKFVFMIETLIR